MDLVAEKLTGRSKIINSKLQASLNVYTYLSGETTDFFRISRRFTTSNFLRI